MWWSQRGRKWQYGGAFHAGFARLYMRKHMPTHPQPHSPTRAHTHTHTELYYADCFSTATVDSWTRLNVTLHVYSLSCLPLLTFISSAPHLLLFMFHFIIFLRTSWARHGTASQHTHTHTGFQWTRCNEPTHTLQALMFFHEMPPGEQHSLSAFLVDTQAHHCATFTQAHHCTTFTQAHLYTQTSNRKSNHILFYTTSYQYVYALHVPRELRLQLLRPQFALTSSVFRAHPSPLNLPEPTKKITYGSFIIPLKLFKPRNYRQWNTQKSNRNTRKIIFKVKHAALYLHSQSTESFYVNTSLSAFTSPCRQNVIRIKCFEKAVNLGNLITTVKTTELSEYELNQGTSKLKNAISVTIHVHHFCHTSSSVRRYLRKVYVVTNKMQ
jgi:hypothetical protein